MSQTNFPASHGVQPVRRLRTSEGNGVAIALSVLVGTLAFLLLVGRPALEPTNIAWLQYTDAVFQYLAWKFFAQTPWALPPGINPLYGLEFSNSIFYSDSIPLFALLFKLAGFAQEGEFQYFGIWLLLCFCLQFLAGYLISGLISDRIWLRAVIATFFVFAPVMVWRLYGHYALLGQFLIIFALFLNLTDRRGSSLLFWTFLIGAAALIHAYLLAMVLPLWGSDIINRWRKGEKTTQMAAIEAAAVVFSLVAALWAAGFFVMSGGYGEGGFGYYRMDVLALLNPMGWSYILRDLPVDEGEGFNFVGLGMLLIILMLVSVRLGGRHEPVGPLGLPIPLLVVLAIFTLVALTNQLSLGPCVLTIPLPDAILSIFSVVRASERFFWPSMYLLYFVVFTVAVRTFGERRAGAALAICLAIQVVDTSAAWRMIRESKTVAPASSWGEPASSQFWGEAAKRYDSLRTIPQGRDLRAWDRLSLLAANHGMGTTAAVLARLDPAKASSALRDTAADIGSAKFKSDTLYVMNDAWALRALLSLDPSRDVLSRVDGHNVLAPGWAACSTCPTLQPLSAAELVGEAPLGTELSFSTGGSGTPYLLDGWSVPENWGVWTEGRKSSLIFQLPLDDASLPLRLTIEAQGLFGGQHPHQSVRVFVNDVPVGQIRFDGSENRGSRTFEVPLEARPSRSGGVLDVSFQIENPVRPVDLGMGNDPRQLGMGLSSLRLDRAY